MINGEYLDLYDNNRKLTGEKLFREKGKKANVLNDKNVIVVIAFIENKDGEYLLQKTFKSKGNIWALTGGHVKSGQSSLEAIKEEIQEELGLTFDESDIKLFKTYKYENVFKDVYYIKHYSDFSNIKLQLEEVEAIEFFDKQDIIKLVNQNQVRETNIDAILDFFNI